MLNPSTEQLTNPMDQSGRSERSGPPIPDTVSHKQQVPELTKSQPETHSAPAEGTLRQVIHISLLIYRECNGAPICSIKFQTSDMSAKLSAAWLSPIAICDETAQPF